MQDRSWGRRIGLLCPWGEGHCSVLGTISRRPSGGLHPGAHSDNGSSSCPPGSLPCLTSDSPPMHPGTPLRSTTCTRILSQTLLLTEPNLRPSFYRWAEEGRTDEGGRSSQTRRGVDETATTQARARGSQGREQHLLVCWAGMFSSGPR